MRVDRAPGCGKSTFTARYPASWRVCLDVYRRLATDSEADQSATPAASEIQNLLLDARLSRGLRTVVDSTNVFGHVRAGLTARARYWQRPAVAVLFDVPLATAEGQNAARGRVVPLPSCVSSTNCSPPSASCTTKGSPPCTGSPNSPPPTPHSAVGRPVTGLGRGGELRGVEASVDGELRDRSQPLFLVVGCTGALPNAGPRTPCRDRNAEIR
ncbi:AAA family ATPase [Streptomyces niveus]|uniref:AAA family ATPase n=1 Tax=Streptomyces niveus TaxID=193462 RepID=UPI003644183C